MKRKLFLNGYYSTLLLSCSVLFSSAATGATCTVVAGGALTSTYKYPEALIALHAPAGTLLGGGQSYTSSTLFYSCVGVTPNASSYSLGVKATGAYVMTTSYSERIYSTNVPGIGYSLDAGGSAPPVGSINYGLVGRGNTIQGDINTSGVSGSFTRKTNFSVATSVRLHSTGATVNPGIFPRQKVGEVILSVNNINQPPIDIYVGSIPIKVLSCAVTTPNVSIPMGDFLTSDFSGVGSRTAKKAFTWSLDCPTHVSFPKITLGSSATAGPNGTAKLIGAGQDNVASGVGARIFDPTGIPLNLSDAKIRRPYLLPGSHTFAYSVAYEQTAAIVTAGKADSTVTMTLTYE